MNPGGDAVRTGGATQDGGAAFHRKLGQCLMRLQQVEVGLKWLASRTYLEAPAAEFAEEHAHRAERIAKHTLGTVNGAVLEKMFVDEGWVQPESELDDSAPVSFGVGIAIEIDPDSRAALAGRLKDLVKRRNLMVHGLITKFDLDTEAGRSAAEHYLDETLAEAEAVRAEVRLWVESARELGERLEQPDVLGRLFAEPNDPQ